jgi:LysM repeat protein
MSVFKCDIKYTKIPGDSKTSAVNLLKSHNIVTNSMRVVNYEKAIKATNELSAKASALLNRNVTLFNYTRDGKLLTPNSILFTELDMAVNRDVKLDTRSLYNNFEASDFQKIVTDVKQKDIWSVLLDPTNREIVKNRQVTIGMAIMLSKMFNVDYQIITEQEANDLVIANGLFYSGQPGFYVGNKVYLVEGKFNKDTVLHEFGHVLVKGIKRMNPSLYQNLVKDLEKDVSFEKDIEEILATDESVLGNRDKAIEELMTRKVESLGNQKLEDIEKTDPLLFTFLTKLLYAIRKGIRVLFQRPSIKVEKINFNTKLETIVEGMINAEIEIDLTEKIQVYPEDFFLQFKSYNEKLNQELAETIGMDKLNKVIENAYNEFSYQLNEIKNTPQILASELRKANAPAYLRSITQQLRDYAVKDLDSLSDEELVEGFEKHQEEMFLRLSALMNSLAEIEKFVDAVENVLKKLDVSTNPGIAVAQLMYFESYLSRQLVFINNMKKELKLDNNNDLIRKLDGIENKIKANQNKSKEKKFEFVTKFFDEKAEVIRPAILNLLSEKINPVLKSEGFAEDQIAKIKADIVALEEGVKYSLEDLGLGNISNPAKKNITETINRYLAKRLNEEAIEAFIKGERGDIGSIEAGWLPMINIDDPVTGGMARWLREIQSNAEQVILDQASDFAKQIVSQLNQLGYNPNKTTMLADLLLEIDKVGVVENGEFVEKEIYKFIDTHINWRADHARLKHALEVAREGDDKDAKRKAYFELKDWEDKYTYRPHTKPYRDLQKFWSQENTVVNPFTKENINISVEISQTAKMEKNAAFAKMKVLNNKAYKELEMTAEYTIQEEAQKEYNQLFNIYNPDGSQKTGDELAKVLVRKKYRELSKEFYEYIPMNVKLQSDLNGYISALATENITLEDTPEKFQEAIERFEKRYMRKAYSSKYYEDMQTIMKGLKEITSKYIETNPELAEKTALLEERSSLILKDSFGNPDGTQLSKELSDRILEIDKKVEELTKSINLKTGLNAEDNAKLNSLKNTFAKNRGKLSNEEMAEYNSLMEKGKPKAMLPEDYIIYKRLLGELFELTTKQPTSYYFDAFLYAIGDVEVEQITPATADDYINNEELLKEAFDKKPEFKKWFMQNHYQKEVWENNAKVNKWFRTSQWNVSIPKEPVHIQKTEVTDPISGKKFLLNGVPAGKYTFTKVKNMYMTVPEGQEKNFVGKYVDNQYNFLPRPYIPGDSESAFDDKYVNKEYEAIKRAGGARFELLETFKQMTLKMQEGAPLSSRLYMDYPRQRVSSNLEQIERGAVKEGWSNTIENIKSQINVFQGDKNADASSSIGFNYSSEKILVTTNMEGETISRIPIRGLTDLKPGEVSLDVLNSFHEYMYSITMAKSKLENEPIALAIKDVLSDKENGIKDLSKASKQIYKNHKAWQYISKSDNKRVDAMNELINRFFYGDYNSEFQQQNPIITRLANAMMGNASRAFIMLDIPSAVKNRWGMIFQAHVEAAAGKYMDFQSFGKGRIRSATTIWELSTQGIYNIADLPKDVMLMQSFDVITGKTEKDFGKNASRSMMKDFFDLTWLYDFRRFAEVEAGLQVFWGMMYKKEVEQVQSNGEVIKIKYADAWDKSPEGKLILKEGINVEYANRFVDHVVLEKETIESIAKKYNIEPEKIRKKNNLSSNTEIKPGDSLIIGRSELFNDFKLKTQGVQKRLNGTMTDLDRPQASKFLVFRLFTFYKAFAIGMYMNRFQADMHKDNRLGEVYDYEMGDMNIGWNISVLNAMKKFFTQGPASYKYMTETEKQAFKRLAAEGAQLLLLAISLTLLFGYDTDDEDRFKKMAKRQDDYGTLGWAGNHILYQFMMVKSENEMFTPYAGWSQSLSLTDKVSIATGPTVNLYVKIVNDLINMATGSDAARYKGDVGPYFWQKEGEYKLWQHAFSLFGVKGKTYSPAHAIRTAEQFERIGR